jgi:hypothetical protein
MVMKKRVVLLLGLALIELPAAAQSGVFKCTDSFGAVAYQGSPCGVQSAQVTLVEPRKREPVAESTAAMAAQPQIDSSETRSVFAGDELIPGMSDTKVLNMRGWGRPQHIARSRVEDGWREDWTYVSRADGLTRLVQFVNGKVTGIRSQDAQPLTRIKSQPRTEAPQIVQASPPPQDPAIDAAARAEEAAKAVERMARREAPSSAAIRWESPGATSASEARSFAAPVEREAAPAQNQEPLIGQPNAAVVQSAPSGETSRRERVHVIRTDPPAPDATPPQAVVQSSAFPDSAGGGD